MFRPAGRLLPPEIVQFLGTARRDILVVSDRYPPEAVGGAEISLHLCLRREDLSNRVLVVVFAKGPSEARLYWQDGVPVLCLPDADPWPIHFSQSGSYASASRRGRLACRLYTYLMGAACLMAGGSPATLPDRATALWFEVTRKPRGGIANDFALGRFWHRRRAIRRVLGLFRPERILLDNYRSILLGETVRRAAPGAEVTALVRDNRFTCARHDQARRIGATACTTCGFACASGDAGDRARWHRRHLDLSARARVANLAAADRVVVTSSYLEDGIRSALPSARISRIPNPSGDLREVGEHIRGVAEWPGQNLLIVGMLNENKGQLQFLRHAAGWLRADRRRCVHLAGRGDRIAERIRQVAGEEGVAGQVRLHGYLGRADLFRLARQCQVIVAPTVWPEPFGRVPLEAGLARRPIVAFAQGGLRETIADGTTGFLVPPGDYGRLLDRVDRLLDDPALAQELGTAGYRRVTEVYSLERVGRAFADLFDRPGRGAPEAG